MAKGKRKKNHYFTKEHEDAIVEYTKTRDRYAKGKLYEKWIQPAFDEMVDKICYTYRFTSLPNSGYLRDDCKLWLITILEKYDPTKGHKAFSYFSVVTKNWFIQQAKKNAPSMAISPWAKLMNSKILKVKVSPVASKAQIALAIIAKTII